MKFKAKKSELLYALSVAGRPIGKSVMPILDNYRFQITENKLLITGSSMEVFISKTIDIESDIQSLDICVSAKKIFPYVKSLSDQLIEFKINEKIVKDKKQYLMEIKASTGECKIPLDNGENYPMTPVIDSHEVEILNQDLLTGFDKTTFAVDTSPMKVTSNVLIKFGNGIQITGANPFYLSTVKVFNNTINNKTVLVSRTALDIMVSIGSDGNTKVSYSDSHICFETENGIKVYSIIADQKYPDIKGFLEIKTDKHIKVNTNDFKAAINRVILFTDLIVKLVKINLSDKGITLSTSNEMEESAIENVSCEYSGEPFDIGVISEQMLAVLGKIKSENIYFSFSDNKKPILIKEEETESLDNVFLVIPSNPK